MKPLNSLVKIIYFSCSTLSLASGGWISGDTLNTPRYKHASVKLITGDILVTGGIESESIRSGEIYKTEEKRWIIASDMLVPRSSHNLILLNNNEVLAIGGRRERSCEIYNPQSNSWRMADSIHYECLYGQTATLLNDGRVLLVGGYYYEGANSWLLNRCEIYDPASDQWLVADTMSIGRTNHSAILLADGKVLVSGSWNNSTCEIYDPVKGNWTSVSSMNTTRAWHNAVQLSNNNIFVSGGENATGGYLNTCEIYDPEKDVWIETGPLSVPRANHLSIMVDDVYLLFFGGKVGFDVWELYNIQTFSSDYSGFYPVNKQESTGHLLPDTTVISIGGLAWVDTTGIPIVFTSNTCELYDPLITTILNHQNHLIDYFELHQNYPNPFNQATKINYFLDKSAKVNIFICDQLGRKISNISIGYQLPGSHIYVYNAENLSSGIYFYSLRVNDLIKTKKLTVIK